MRPGAAASGGPWTVFFDAGGTVLRLRAPVGEVYAAAVARRGHPVEARAIEPAFREAWRRSLERRRAAQYASSDAVLREEWRAIVAESFGGLVPAGVAAAAFEELYEYFSGPEPWLVAEGARETFGSLRASGVRLGLLSNWDARLPDCLERLGVGSWFDPQVISYAVGVEKPHARIFEEAARRAGAGPGRLVMVGDSLDLGHPPRPGPRVARGLDLSRAGPGSGDPGAHPRAGLPGGPRRAPLPGGGLGGLLILRRPPGPDRMAGPGARAIELHLPEGQRHCG